MEESRANLSVNPAWEEHSSPRVGMGRGPRRPMQEADGNVHTGGLGKR